MYSTFFVLHISNLYLNIAEFLKFSQDNVMNTHPFNITGHPSISINIGMTHPEDVS